MSVMLKIQLVNNKAKPAVSPVRIPSGMGVRQD